MKVILAIVTSLDGKTTKWGNPDIYQWTSQEDQKYFFSLIKKHSVIIMGRKTYEAAKSVIKLTSGKLRIVMTGKPEKYMAECVTGQLEFSDHTPEQIVEELHERGYTEVLLVGGEAVTTAFLKAKLINEIHITIEPVLFGKGNGVISKEEFSVSLQLKEIKQLNKKGTLLLTYYTYSS